MNENGRWLGWHWLRKNCELQHDGRVVKPGLTFDNPKSRYGEGGNISLCNCGYHASRKILNALSYAPGPIICRVELSGDIKEDDEKAAAERRTCLWMADADRVLNEFACTIAENFFTEERNQGKCVPPILWEAIEYKRKWGSRMFPSKEVRQRISQPSSGESREASDVAARLTLLNYSWATACDISSHLEITLASRAVVCGDNDDEVYSYRQWVAARNTIRDTYNEILTNMINTLAPPDYKELQT
jgi:hypothetical protein